MIRKWSVRATNLLTNFVFILSTKVFTLLYQSSSSQFNFVGLFWTGGGKLLMSTSHSKFLGITKGVSCSGALFCSVASRWLHCWCPWKGGWGVGLTSDSKWSFQSFWEAAELIVHGFLSRTTQLPFLRSKIMRTKVVVSSRTTAPSSMIHRNLRNRAPRFWGGERSLEYYGMSPGSLGLAKEVVV